MKTANDTSSALERLGFIGFGNMAAPSRCVFCAPVIR